MEQICYNHQYFKRYKKLTQITTKAFCEDIIKRERQSIIEDLQGPFFLFLKNEKCIKNKSILNFKMRLQDKRFGVFLIEKNIIK